MSIDIEYEKLIAIRDIPGEVPNRPHISTVWRWIQRGCRGIKLETVLVGGRRYASRESLTRFIEATTAAADGEKPNSSSSRSRFIAQANNELDAAGI